MNYLGVFALLLAGAHPADAQEQTRFDDGVHVAVAAGGGIAFGSVGVHLELLAGHFAAFLGTGVDLHVGEPWSLAGGLRAFSGRGEGFMLSLNGALFSSKCCFYGPPFNPSSEYRAFDYRYVSATLGYRARAAFGGFVELGAGVGWLRDLEHGTLTGANFSGCPTRGYVYVCDRRNFFPDVDAAIGFEF